MSEAGDMCVIALACCREYLMSWAPDARMNVEVEPGKFSLLPLVSMIDCAIEEYSKEVRESRNESS